MKKLLTIAAVLMMACGVWAESYLYWMLEDTGIEFAYATITARDADGNVLAYLADAATGSTIYWDDATDPHTKLLVASYSELPLSPTEMRIFVEVYNAVGSGVGISSGVAIDSLTDFIYTDMSTTGIRAPYRFMAFIPEPSGGILFLLGFGALALRRKRSL